MSKIVGVIIYLLLSISTAWAIEVGRPVPVCNAKLLETDEILDIQSYKGKVVFIDFWATWCPPCKKSMPFLNALRNELKDQGFEIVAINVDENQEDAKNFLQQFPVDYVVALEPSGECPEKYAVQAMPSSYFIDRKGIVRAIHLGFRSRDEAEIRQRVLQLLEEKT